MVVGGIVGSSMAFDTNVKQDLKIINNNDLRKEILIWTLVPSLSQSTLLNIAHHI